jgi:nucleolin
MGKQVEKKASKNTEKKVAKDESTSEVTESESVEEPVSESGNGGSAGEESGSIAEETSSGATAEEAEDKTKNTIFIKGLSYDLTEHELKEEMEKLGKVVRVGIPMTNEARRNKGFGYVEFSREEDAKRALKLNRTTFLGREVIVDMATPRTEKSRYTVYVGNVPYEVDKSKLREYFESFGKVVGMSLPYDKENDRYRGFAFVDYANKKDFEAVLRKKLDFEDSTLYQRAANKPSERDQRGGDRRYNDRGSRDGGFRNRRFDDRERGDRGGSKRSFDDSRRAGKKVKFDSDSE